MSHAQPSVHGAADCYYDNPRGPVDRFLIVADDIMARDDADLRGVLRTMQERLAAGQYRTEFRSGRLDVTIRSSRGGGSDTLACAAETLTFMYGSTVAPRG